MVQHVPLDKGGGELVNTGMVRLLVTVGQVRGEGLQYCGGEVVFGEGAGDGKG